MPAVKTPSSRSRRSHSCSDILTGVNRRGARQNRSSGRTNRHDPRAEADRLVDVGLNAQAAGRPLDAVAAYKKALQSNPLSLDAHMNLGTVFTSLGQQRSAVVHLKRALSLAPGEPKVAHDASWSLLHLGRWELALPILNRLLASNPNDAAALAKLAFLHLENGRRAEAVAAATRAIELEPSKAENHYLLYRTLYDDRNPSASLAALQQAVRWDPEEPSYRFFLGVLLDECGDRMGSKQIFDGLAGKAYAGGISSWHYVKEHRTSTTRIFSTTRDTLVAALDAAGPDGSTLEFGVRYGISTRWLAEKAPIVHGFDSFEGLPEQWHVQPEGAYSTHGEAPELPPNVILHVGWFDSTLPVFVKDNTEPVRLMNVDCDLYRSTKVVFDQLASRIGPGTVLVFDEYIVNDKWREDEFKAFQEAVAEHGWRYEYLAFSITDFQAVVRIQ